MAPAVTGPTLLPARPSATGAGRARLQEAGRAALDRFLYGMPYADLLAHGPKLPLNTAWRRLLHRTGAVDAVRAACGGWAPAVDAPESEETIAALVPRTGPRADTVVDVVAVAGGALAEARLRDETFARYDQRWSGGRGALRDLVPADIGAVRSRLAPPGALLAHHGLATPHHLQDGRLLRVSAGLAAYSSVPHFVPGPLAEDAATTAMMDAQTRTELTLPAPSVLLFHDGVPFDAVADDRDLVEAAGEGRLPLGDAPVVMGGVLNAREDGHLDEGLGWLLTAATDRSTGVPLYSLVPVPYGGHPAGRALYGYAALLAFENWRPPPELPRRDGPGRRDREIKKLARTRQARDGGFHGVHLLDYEPPPEEPAARTRPAAGAGELVAGTWRRAHVRPRVRYGIRDGNGRKVGPVYKEQAVLGVTYEYRHRWVARTRIRPDLPLADRETVYALGGPGWRV